jgi:hypothetical protein
MDTEYDNLIRERFTKLPKVVQDAITSADVSAHMRELADKHKLHLDQWGSLENEVHLTLLGVEPAENLAKNIASEVGVDAVTAGLLAEDIFKTVFEPIREQLERELQHPDSVASHDTTAPSPQSSAQTPAAASAQGAPQSSAPEAVGTPSAVPPVVPTNPVTPVVPATPPAAAPTAKVERAPLSQSYVPSQASHERKSIEGDPYREQIV